MKNKLSSGKLVNVTLSADAASGAGLLVGAMFGVLVKAGKTGDVVPLDREGEFTLPAATHASTQAVAQGGKVYWDATNKICTATATDNTFIGYASVAKVSTATEVTVIIG